MLHSEEPLPLLKPEALASLEDDCPATLELDDDGIVVSANDQAAHLLGREKAKLVGLHFFREAAPWSQNQMFWGKFRKGVDDDAMDLSFPYVVMAGPILSRISVRMVRQSPSGRNWVSIHTRSC